MAWQQQVGAAPPSAQQVDDAAKSAAWEIIPSGDTSAGDVSVYSNIDHPTYALPSAPSYSSSLLSSPRRGPSLRQRQGEAPTAAPTPALNPLLATLGDVAASERNGAPSVNLGKELPASPTGSYEALPSNRHEASPASSRLPESSSTGSGVRFSANTSSPTAPTRASNEVPSSSSSGSKLESSGGAAGLFGAPSASSKVRKFSIPWRQRVPSSQGTSFESRSSRDRPGTANTESEPRTSELTPRLSSTVLPSPAQSSDDPASLRLSKMRPTETFGDDSQAFFEHVNTAVPREEIAAVLTASGDELHKGALRLYMRHYLFANDPLDVALRKMLMSLSLPKETQQIDRVMEAFAHRYNECNTGLFDNDDQPYVLAFSLMMLHTDSFNRNAKQKMSKADYIRNTSSCGLYAEVLDYFYDNLTFTEFIHVEDDESTFPGNKRKASAGTSDVGAALRSAVTKPRIDPYYLIATGQTGTLRANIELMVPKRSPFRPYGTAQSFDFDALHRAFVSAPCIEIVTSFRPHTTHAAAGAMTSSFANNASALQDDSEEQVVALRITKVGCISRKDDMMDDSRKAPSRKWRTCGMILSASQLLFFKDLVWTSALEQQITEQVKQAGDPDKSVVISPRITYFKPDGVLALTDAVAVQDDSDTKYNHVFRLFAKHGDLSRQYLVQTPSEEEMNDWIHKINFCSTFRSTGIRIRGLDPPSPKQRMSTESTDSGLSESQEHMNENVDGVSGRQADGRFLELSKLSSTMRKKLNARQKEIAPMIKVLEGRIAECEIAIEKDLHFIKHLSILTPWMKSTRDRLRLTASPIAARIRALRLSIARFACRRELLELEMDASERAAIVAPSPTQFDALEFAQRSFWSASSTSLNVSSYSSAHGDDSRRGSDGSMLSSRSPSALGSRLGSQAYLEMPLASRFSFSDATGSLFTSQTSTPGNGSDANTEHEFSDYDSVQHTDAHSSRTHGVRGSSASAASSLRRASSTPQGPAQADESSDANDLLSPLQDNTGVLTSFRRRDVPRTNMLDVTSPLYAATLSNASSSSSHHMPLHSGSNSSLYKRFSSTAAAEASLGAKQPPREEPEAWNRSRVARGDNKRVSLVQLPEGMDWRHLGEHRGSLVSNSSHYDTASNGGGGNLSKSSSSSGSEAADLTRLAMDRLRLHSSLATSVGP